VQVEGWANVSIKRSANAIDYTPSILYRHFENEDAIVVALRQRSYRLLPGSSTIAPGLFSKVAAELARVSTIKSTSCGLRSLGLCRWRWVCPKRVVERGHGACPRSPGSNTLTAWGSTAWGSTARASACEQRRQRPHIEAPARLLPIHRAVLYSVQLMNVSERLGTT
jgi:AcrR family transcriptional regulator